jgi:hypothetical protein
MERGDFSANLRGSWQRHALRLFCDADDRSTDGGAVVMLWLQRWWVMHLIRNQQYLQRWHRSGLTVATGNYMDSAAKLEAAQQRENLLQQQLTDLEHPIRTRRLYGSR